MAFTKSNPDAEAEGEKEIAAGPLAVRCLHCGKIINKADLIDGGGVKLCPNCHMAIDEAHYA